MCFLFLTPSSFSVYRRVRTKSHEREPVPKIASLFILDSIYIYIVFPGQDGKSTEVQKAKKMPKAREKVGLCFRVYRV